MTPELKQAKLLANSLGISLYIRDGHIYQTGPGERIEPDPGARPTPHGDGPTIVIAEPAKP